MLGMSFDFNLGIGGFDETGETMSQDSTIHDGGTRIVCLLSQNFFRQRLVEHFDILWKRNELVKAKVEWHYTS
jgi:hypothetical protein